MGSNFEKDRRLSIGFAAAAGRRSDEELTPAEKRLLEEVAERLLQEHRETLKTLGDE